MWVKPITLFLQCGVEVGTRVRISNRVSAVQFIQVL